MKEMLAYNNKKYKIVRIIIQAIIIIALIAGIIYGTIAIYPYIQKIQADSDYKNNLIEQIRFYGNYSIIIIILLHILQTIFMVIPASLITMASSVLLTPGMAVLTSIIGQTLGGIIVYILIKQFGVSFLALVVDPKIIYKSRLLKNKERIEVMMFGYLLIPALPKDIVAFIAPFTGVKLNRFIIIYLYARIPMTIVNVLIGVALLDFNIILLAVLVIISTLSAILCLIFHNKIEAFLGKGNNYLSLF